MATATKRQEDAPPTVQPGSIVELVHDLSKVGLTPARIASLILTTPNTVSQRKREKRPEWPPKVKAGRNGSD
jgi:hypothetical protein